MATRKSADRWIVELTASALLAFAAARLLGDEWTRLTADERLIAGSTWLVGQVAISTAVRAWIMKTFSRRSETKLPRPRN
jgi:hypothetical protein